MVVLKVSHHFIILTGSGPELELSDFIGNSISMFSIGTTWNKICETRYDPESQLFALLTSCGKYLVPDDLKPLIMDVVETHPGLEFLRSAPEFHSRYVTTLGKFISITSS